MNGEALYRTLIRRFLDTRSVILSPSQAGHLVRSEGLKAGYLHFHTDLSNDVASVPHTKPLRILNDAKAKGVDYVAFTDHDLPPYDVDLEGLIGGMEISIADRSVGQPVHLGVLGITDLRLADELLGLRRNGDAYAVAKTAKENGVFPVLFHPWWIYAHPGHVNSRDVNLQTLWEIANELRLPLEWNTKRPLPENIMTYRTAMRYDLPLFQASDSHTGVSDLTHAVTLAKGDTPVEFLRNVYEGNAFFVPPYQGFCCVAAIGRQYLFDLAQSDKAVHLESGNPFFDDRLRRFYDDIIGPIRALPSHERVSEGDAMANRYEMRIRTYLPLRYLLSATHILFQELKKERPDHRQMIGLFA